MIRNGRPTTEYLVDTASQNNLSPRTLLEGMNDGVYATDADRRIVYWSRAAERITGWREEDILGKRCADDVLCHVDKDGRPLCTTETCPLHRAIVTGQGSQVPIIVFAQGSDGRRIPMRVSVAPVRNDSGEVIGGIETFREVTEELKDAQLARRIQSAMLGKELPRDDRVAFSTRYLPLGMIGGDYYAVRRVDAGRFAFIVADVSGHGVAAALYTVYLDALWQGHPELLARPAELAGVMNEELSALIGNEPRFATAVLGLVDLHRTRLVLAFAGGPPPFLCRGDGGIEAIEGAGIPLGCFEETQYEQRSLTMQPGDCLLSFTDGALEVSETGGKMLGAEGLVRVLEELGYPASGDFEAISERLLTSSDRIRFDDDLTFLEIRLS